MKNIFIGILFLILLFPFPEVINAQPYIFKTGANPINPDRAFDEPESYNVYKINLGNNQKTEITECIGEVICDNTQKWLAVEVDRRENRYSMMNINNSNKSESYDCSILPNMMVYSKVHKKLFTLGSMLDTSKEVSWMMSRVFGEYLEVLSIQNGSNSDEEVFIKMDTPNDQGKMFLSANENMLYVPFFDTITYHSEQYDKINVAYISTIKDKIIKKKKLAEIGYPDAIGYGLKHGKKGKGIIISFYKNSGNHYYNIYDFDHDSSSPFIYYQGDSDPYFTTNGKYLIINKMKDSLSDGGQMHHFKNTGILNIYDASNCKLIKILQLPPQRTVYTFDNFPDNLYYYNDKTEKAITLNINSLVNISSGPTDSPKVIMYNLGTTVFTADFINGKIKYELGKGYTSIKPDTSPENKLNFNEYDENNNLLGVFSFDKGYINGTYTSNKNNKVFHFSRIDTEP